MILKLSAAAAVITTILTAFLVVRSGDEAVVKGASTVVTVWDDGGLTRVEAERAIVAAARQERITLYRSITSVESGITVRSLSVANQGDDRALPGVDEQYPDFGRSLHTRFRPAPNGISPGGMYVTGATEIRADRFVAVLRQQGLDVTAVPFGFAGQFWWTAGAAPLLPLLMAALLGMILGCVSSTVGARRQDAVRVANGMSRTDVAFRQCARVILLVLAYGVIGLAVSVLPLAIYNGLAQFARFAGTTAVGIGLAAVVGGAVVLVTSLLANRRSLLPALEGRLPFGRLTLFGLVAHGAAVGLVVAVLASAIAAGWSASENRRDSAEWDRGDDLYALSFRLSNTEGEKFVDVFAALGLRAIAEGRALVSTRPLGGPEDHGPDGGGALIVNDRYLAEQTIRDHTGKRVEGSNLRPDELTLLVPDDLRGVPELVSRYEEWIRFRAEADGRRSDDSRVPIHVIRTAGGQRVFNYSTRETTSSQLDPVVAVVPSSRPVLSSDWIVSGMTQGTVLFTDRTRLERDLRSSSLDSSAWIVSARDLAEVRLDGQEHDLRTTMSVALLAGIVAVLAAFVFAAASAEISRRGDFLRLVHGDSGLRTVLLPATLAVASAGAASGLALSSHLSVSPSTFSPCGVVLLADVLAVALFISVRSRRLRADTLKKS
ncbi:hypothetical protein [Frondihabitans cladoniiphilus]|uniref:FtsX-like permease family protein n=1 Tax=Frondihabitans cladoniiphilus TaxID=715785 RepID=A0ABP8WF89_9MICO